MAFNFAEDKLAEIRNTADIVDVISARVFLKKAGKDYAGLCPFHAEKTPSFTVSPDKQIYHCFGCGVGGDVFDFIMAYEGITFPEAAQALARQYGIELPSRQMSPQEQKQASEREQLLAINRKVLEFYREMLLKSRAGQAARQYLKDRGTAREVIDRFGLGFAPAGWDHLIRFLGKSGVALPLAEKAGLIVPKKQRGYYDRFRNRIMFPIFDVTNQVVGFGGRVLDDAKPKYLNSPETPVYNKRRTLYGLHAAKNSCRDKQSVFIVEGYFDLLALHQYGIPNSVATLGTALTQSHVRRLKGYARKAYLVFDSDEAGIKAAERTIGLFMDEGLEAAVVMLPKGHDPDSYLFEFGAEAFFAAAEAAYGLFDFLIESAVAKHGLSMEGKVRIISQLAEPLAEINDSVARSLYQQHLAERIGVEESAILEKMQQTRTKTRAKDSKKPASGGRSNSENTRPVDRMESRVIAMMLQHPDILDEIKKQQVLDFFEDHRLKQIGEQILQVYPKPAETVSDLMNHIDDDSQRQLIASLGIEDGCWADQSCAMLLSQFFKTKGRRQNELLNRIRAAEQSNDQQLLMQLLAEKQKQTASRS
ncbi:MAG: DNA primase [Thermodesulfobacteriota bacterium]